MQTEKEIKGLSVISDVFDEISSYEWLERAYRKAAKGKRYRGEVLEFASDLDANLHRISQQLRDGTFRFGPYRKHWVYVPKKRLVMALPFDGRVVQWAIYLKLNPFFDRMMIEDSYACRVGKGTLKAVNRLQHWMRLVNGKGWYALKLDISKYFYRVDHKKMLEILCERIHDRRLIDLLEQVIQCDSQNFGLPRFMSPEDVEDWEWLDYCGMPIGNLTSQMFANIYLSKLDQFCKHKLKIRKYIRYMDDIYALFETKEQAHSAQAAIGHYLLNELHLDLNRKTSVRPVDRAFFCGFEVTAFSLQLRKQTVRRIKESLRMICRRYFSGEYTKKEFDRRIASYQGMIKHCDSASLRYRLNEIYLRAKEEAAREIARNRSGAERDSSQAAENHCSAGRYHCSTRSSCQRGGGNHRAGRTFA